MAKGISAVIATIMLLMITVALISVFYIFGSSLLGGTTTEATGTVNSQVNALTKTVALPVANCTIGGNINVSVQNTGSVTISAGNMRFYMDDMPNNTQISRLADVPVSGQIYAGFRLIAGQPTAGTKTLKVVTPSGPATTSVTCG